MNDKAGQRKERKDKEEENLKKMVFVKWSWDDIQSNVHVF